MDKGTSLPTPALTVSAMPSPDSAPCQPPPLPPPPPPPPPPAVPSISDSMASADLPEPCRIVSLAASSASRSSGIVSRPPLRVAGSGGASGVRAGQAAGRPVAAADSELLPSASCSCCTLRLRGRSPTRCCVALPSAYRPTLH
ncbi:hypothetical protein TSOC_002248 [Tetrabaena socialis]|uniref:Uncharacterized protein n=1 Tax=Tetrabaena socialis TaxID=47790 RepID=A0A2J8AEN2_9CHLO|nr:hypothetical protein TSOC_002248 [Tetrabaena socialis]|eukprot:PNH10956.1 hypothetical protein TSOC_002248 [Tetrabaena socialis]